MSSFYVRICLVMNQARNGIWYSPEPRLTLVAEISRRWLAADNNFVHGKEAVQKLH